MKKILLTTAAVATIAAANANFYVGVDVAGQALNTKLSGGNAAGTKIVTGINGAAAAATTGDAVNAAGLDTNANTGTNANSTGGTANAIAAKTTDLENAYLDPNGNRWHHNYRFGVQAGYAMAMEGGFWGALDINAHFGGANKELTAAHDATAGTTQGTLTEVSTGDPVDATANNANFTFADARKAMTLSNKFNAGIGVKLGFKAGNAIPYVYVGGDYGQFKINDDTPAATADYTTKTKNKFGFAAGVGVIGHINEMVSVEVAYRYSDHGSFNYKYLGNVPLNLGIGYDVRNGATALATADVAVALGASNGTPANAGTAGTPAVTQAIGEVKHKLRSHTATIGFNVHFG